MSIIAVFHKMCPASVNIIAKLNDVPNYKIEYIDIYNDPFEADIEIDVVPIIIVNDKDIFKGKEAFEKIEELKRGNMSTKGKNKIGKKEIYKSNVRIAPEDESSKKSPVKFS